MRFGTATPVLLVLLAVEKGVPEDLQGKYVPALASSILLSTLYDLLLLLFDYFFLSYQGGSSDTRKQRPVSTKMAAPTQGHSMEPGMIS